MLHCISQILFLIYLLTLPQADMCIIVGNGGYPSHTAGFYFGLNFFPADSASHSNNNKVCSAATLLWHNKVQQVNIFQDYYDLTTKTREFS